MSTDICTKLAIDGYALINGYLPEISGISAFSRLGVVVRLPGMAAVQTLTPRRKEQAPPNTYSGNFGIHEFPLHTDLAHWFIPPRYFALRCVVGSKYISTTLVDFNDLLSQVGRENLMRALVLPRRPINRKRSLLRLLSRREDGSDLFRWDSLFVVPGTSQSRYICTTIEKKLATIEAKEVRLENPGDTLIIDNWRMLHGRSQVLAGDELRLIERAYFGSID